MKWAAAVIVCLLFSACSHGFDRTAMRTALSSPGVGGTLEVTDADVKKALELKAQLPHPFTVGIYFVTENSTRRYDDGYLWRWAEEDKRMLEGAFSDLRDRGLVSRVVLISDPTGPSSDLKRIRLAAARYGVDAVLAVSAVGGEDARANPLAFFDVITLTVTGFFNPAHHPKALFMTKTALWDVRNEFLYLTAEAEGEDEGICPLWWRTTMLEKVMQKAKEKALSSLVSELRMRLATLR